MKDDEKIIITTSRLVQKNAVDILIKAAAELKNINSELKFKLLILGDGKLKKVLEKLTADLGLKENVLFLGFIPQEEIYVYLGIADIFVRPSRSEGLGNSFLEAMAVRVPIIGTNVGGIPDFLKDKETGLFCKVDDPRDLAEKIEMLLSNNVLREKIIKNAEKLVREKYDWNNISQEMKKIFLNLS